MPRRPPSRVFPDAVPADLAPRQVAREFRALLDAGTRLVVDGTDRVRPEALLADGYSPRHRVDLFGTRFYLANVRQNPLLRFFVAYVVPPPPPRGPARAHARIFYKDVSLTWRSGSHVVSNEDDLWIGKGDLRAERVGGQLHHHTAEATTDLPLELQAALDQVMRRARVIRRDVEVLTRVLRNAPADRIAPYRDFTEQRRRAQAAPGGRIHGGRRIAWFRRRHDPSSLVFAPGFEPDFARGPIATSRTTSKSYGGTVELVRHVSRNGLVQFLFFAAPRHAWLAPPQALTTELSTYGSRLVDVIVDDDLCLPGFEYHFLHDPEDEDTLHSQIPPGFAGPPNPSDPDRADASAWLDALPVVRAFRRARARRGR